jgi:hypothetical protein
VTVYVDVLAISDVAVDSVSDFAREDLVDFGAEFEAVVLCKSQ